MILNKNQNIKLIINIIESDRYEVDLITFTNWDECITHYQLENTCEILHVNSLILLNSLKSIEGYYNKKHNAKYIKINDILWGYESSKYLVEKYPYIPD